MLPSLRILPEAGFIQGRSPMNERIVALDIGDVRIGVAVTDPTRTIASPVEVITRVGWGPDTRAVKAVCDRYETNLVVSGLPLNMDGTEGFQAKKVRDLCAQLEKAGLTVFFQDERLSPSPPRRRCWRATFPGKAGKASWTRSPPPSFSSSG